MCETVSELKIGISHKVTFGYIFICCKNATFCALPRISIVSWSQTINIIF